MISNATPWPAHRPVRSTRIVTLTILSIVFAFGCGNDEGRGSSGTNGNGTGATNGGGATNGMGATGGDGAVAFSGAALCSIAATPGGGVGFVRLVPDEELEAAEQGEQIDSFEGAIEFPGGVVCAVQNRSVFALNFESPTITRYDEVDGALIEGERVSFANFGLSSLAGSRSNTVFVSDDKAYYLDGSTSQLIVWNPEEMVTIGAIRLGVSERPEALRQSGIQFTLIDGLIVAFNNYSNQQDISVARTDFWFVDPSTNTVVATDTIETCGNLRGRVATATNGDVYLGMSADAAMAHALGLPGSFPPCAVRIRPGTREVDPTYLADLNALTGGLPTAGAIQIGNNLGLLWAYDTNAMPVDPMMTPRELSQAINWGFYEWELGTEQPASRIESLATGTGTTNAFEFDGRSFLVEVAPGFSSSQFFDLANRPVEVTFTFSAGTVTLARLGAAPDARMAQRIKDRGSLGVLSF